MSKSTGWIVAFLLLTTAAWAQTPTPAPAPQPAPMAMDCQAMMEKMQTSMKAMDDQLQPLVAKMNAAKGSARTDAAVAVINELVRQRSQMRDSMMAMMPQMMGHMMGHMQSGAADAMKSCPMMKQGATHEHN